MLYYYCSLMHSDNIQYYARGYIIINKTHTKKNNRKMVNDLGENISCIYQIIKSRHLKYK